MQYATAFNTLHLSLAQMGAAPWGVAPFVSSRLL